MKTLPTCRVGSRFSGPVIPGGTQNNRSAKAGPYLLWLSLLMNGALATAATTAPVAKNLPWLTAMQPAYTEAQAAKQPIFVCVGATWCPWCRELEKELAKPELQAKLARWTRVQLDVDVDRDDAAALRVNSVPALRILSAAGRIIAIRDGYAPAADLIRWLDENYSRAQAAPPAEIIALKALDAAAVKALVADLGDADPTVREGAAARLYKEPKQAAPPLVESLAGGGLATRLSALEVLTAWHAPIEQLDPWRPETLTADRLTALRQWAMKITAPPQRPTTLPAAELATARQEIGRMLKATLPLEVRASRERLARLGPALLEEVLAQLKLAESQASQERLTALRYRLVASDALALTNPGLFERLAAADINLRHKALDELATRAAPDDKDLLLELFSDPDELMREIALRTLQRLGGDASEALVKLLNDPMPNVRAAVLKQLAETHGDAVGAKLLPQVIEYLKQEKDPDLVVHGVRVLRASKGAAAVDALLTLLEHESWRVRAEAVEALQESADDRDPRTGARSADSRIRKAIAARLNDDDGYVVSRAIAALGQYDTSSLIEPLTAGIEKHPALAGDIIRSLTSDPSTAAKLAPALRKFAVHANPDIRAAGLVGLCQVLSTGIDKEILDGLKDAVPAVRIAAAEGMFTVMGRARPQGDGQVNTSSGRVLLGGRFGDITGRAAASLSLSQWLDNFRSGFGRQAWMNSAIPELQKMLTSLDPRERVAAALPLVGLARDDQAIPVLLDTAKKTSSYVPTVALALPWLPSEGRERFFQQLLELQPAAEHLAQIVMFMAVIPDDRAAAALWKLLNDKADAQLGQIVHEGLAGIYSRPDRTAVPGRSPAAGEALFGELKLRTRTGSEMRRLVALLLLAEQSLADAAPAAKDMYEDARALQALRIDTFQILLLVQKKKDGVKTAVAALEARRPAEAKLAIAYLATNGSALISLRDRSWYLNFNNPELERGLNIGRNVTVLPSAPEGLTAEMLLPHLNDGDADIAAYSGYLLALKGERRGFDKLVSRWRAQKQTSYDQWRQMVYTAAAVMNDDELTPVLAEVYASYEKSNQYELRSFYQTIRGMEGKKIMELRRQMRNEVGAALLQ